MYPLLYDEEEAHVETQDDNGSRQRPFAGLTMTLGDDALAALIQRVVHQDAAALEVLYDALSGRIYASALRITRQVGLAEEVMQDTFWQVWRQAPRFDPARGSAVAWVVNIGRSRALDAVRTLQRDQRHAVQVEPESLDSHAADPVEPAELLADSHREGALHRALSALDPLKRQLVALSYYRGLTQDEIAMHTGLPLGTVKSHLRRTLATLRTLLEGDVRAPQRMA